MVLKQLGEAARDLATYQSGIKASTPIFKDGVYVLQDPYEVMKFKTDLRTADYSDTKSLLAVLGSKGYKNIPKDDVPVAVASREDLQALSGSKTLDPLSRALNEHGNYFRGDERPDLVLVPLVAKLRTFETHHFPVPEWLNIRESLIKWKMTDEAPVNSYKGYEPGRTVRQAFADLLTNKATFSVELINSIAKGEQSGKLGGNDSDVFEGTGIKADGRSEHLAFILERLLDLQACLLEQFKEDQPAVAKITAAIPAEQLVNTRKALGVTT